MLILLSYDGDPGDLVEVGDLPFKKVHELIQRWIAWMDGLELKILDDPDFDGTFPTWMNNHGYQATSISYQQVSGNDGYVY